MKRNNLLKGILAAGCVAALGIAGTYTVYANGSLGRENQICKGVHVGSINVGGMTEQAARKQIDSFLDQMEDRRVTIRVGKHLVEASAGELGVQRTEENPVQEAMKVAKSGSFWDRIKEGEKAREGKKDLPLNLTLDKERLSNFVDSKCCCYDVEAKDSKLKYKKGRLMATKSRNGLGVQVEKTMSLLEKAVLKEDGRSSVEVTAPITTTKPEHSRKEVAMCTDLLGEYSTTYSTYQVERSSNVATAAGRINGTILEPGEVFSVVKTIKDRTEANGYKSAPEYSGGKVVSGIGGGVCQVSTTLYNAVINAELKVVERSPHSMMVAYVPISRDAAISGDYKDFKFKNNLDYPVYLMGMASGGVLKFQVYGHETRDPSRKISFESEVVDTIQPGPEVVTEDSSLPAGYRSITQSAHIGYRAKLWKIVKVDGQETERVEVNSSAYNASPQYVTVGRQTPTAAPATEAPEGNKATAAPGQSENGSKAASSNNSNSSKSDSRKSTTTSSSKSDSGKSTTTSSSKSDSAKSTTTSSKSDSDKSTTTGGSKSDSGKSATTSSD